MKRLSLSQESKIKAAKLLSLAVIIPSVAVIIGWIFDVPFLKSISPVWISMKLDTAIAFMLSGVTLYLIARDQEGERDLAQVGLCITSLMIVLLMGILFFSTLLGIHTGAEDLFIKETKVAPMTVVPGRPSFPTTLNFLLLAIASIFVMLNIKNLRLGLKIIGMIIGLIGAVAIMGYIIKAPPLYYYIQGVNSAMSCHTAILFIFLGMGLLCL
ncbi:MAG: hypothetical protein ACM3IL_01675 [Deltaproteobacteria bacterium]